MAYDTEWRSVVRNLAEAVVSDFAWFIVASFFWQRVFHFFFSTLCGVLMSILLRGTTEYLLMGFKVLLPTIYLNTGSSSESEE